MKGRLKQGVSICLSATLVLSGINAGPVYGAADNNTRKTIVGFEELEERYALQELPIGADEGDVKFPSGIWAEVFIEKEEGEVSSQARLPEETSAKAGEETENPELKADQDPDEEKAAGDETAEEETGEKATEEETEEKTTEKETEEEETEEEETGEKTPKEKTIEKAAEKETEEKAEEKETGEKAEEKETEEKAEEKETGEKAAEKETEEKAPEEETAGGRGTGSDDAVSGQEPSTPSQTKPAKEETKETGKTVRRKIREIEWELNFAESTEPEFSPDRAGTYIYEPVIPSGYEMDADLDLPRIEVIVGDEAQKEGIVLTAEAGGCLITVAADPGVFLEGVSLSAELIENQDKTAELKAAVEELEGNGEIADEELVYFDITILDKDGNEVQPDNEKGSVTIAFKSLEEGSERIKAPECEIYHMDEESQTLEKKDATVTEQEVQAEMEHFSPVIVRTGRASAEVIVTSSGELKNALLLTSPSKIKVNQDITYSETDLVVAKAAHTLEITAGNTLTHTGNIIQGSSVNKPLTIQGAGKVVLTGKGTRLKGGINLGGDSDQSITVEIKGTGACIAANLNVNKGAEVVADSPDGEQLIHLASTKNPVTLNVNPGGKVTIKDFKTNAINCISGGVININGGTIAINSAGASSGNRAGINLAGGGALNLTNGGTLTGSNNGALELAENSKVTGMNGRLSDQEKNFDKAEVTTVLKADVVAEANKLTAGLYKWNSTTNRFAKPAAAQTGLKDGVLTIANKTAAKGTGWAWNGTRLDLNRFFVNNKRIEFADGIKATIQINSDFTIQAEANAPAIVASSAITITAKNGSVLTVTGPIQAGDITITNKVIVDAKVDNSKIPALAVDSGGAIKIISTTVGDPMVTVSNKSGAAMSKAPDTSKYTDAKISASKNPGGTPKVKYETDKISSYKYLKVEKGVLLNENSTVKDIEKAVDLMDAADVTEIDKVVGLIKNMDSKKRETIAPETLKKTDQLLAEATNSSLVVSKDVDSSAELTNGTVIKSADIMGAMIAAGVTAANNSNAGMNVTFKVVQKKPEDGAAVAFDCSLFKGSTKVTNLAIPVTVTIGVPGEYIYRRGSKIRHVKGNGEVEYLDFVFKNNKVIEFRTGSFSSFSIIEPADSGSSGGSGGGGGGGGRGMAAVGGFKTGPQVSSGGKWLQDANGWWYQYPDNTYPKDGWAQIEHMGKSEWYYFDKKGYMVSGWILCDGKWYYLNTALDGNQGKMHTGWQLIDGKWYYLNEASDGTRGARLTDTWVGDYYLNKEGVWEEGKKKQER